MESENKGEDVSLDSTEGRWASGCQTDPRGSGDSGHHLLSLLPVVCADWTSSGGETSGLWNSAIDLQDRWNNGSRGFGTSPNNPHPVPLSPKLPS